MSEANNQPETNKKNTTPANNNEFKTVQNSTEATPVKKKKRGKFLSIAFNIAAGAGAAMATKAFVVSMMMTCTPLSVLLVSSLAVGAAMTLVKHGQHRYQASKNKTEFNKFFTKKTAKDFATSSAFALVGGAIFMGFQLDSFKDLFQPIHSAVAPVLPADTTVNNVAHVPAVPVEVAHTAPITAPVVCISPLEEFAHNIDASHVSERVSDAMTRAASSNVHVAAQGTKDLAYFTFNGFDGVPKDQNLALELFQKAADAGNLQAKTDLLYAQFHGLAHVVTNPQHAANVMQNIETPKAESFTKAWNSMGYSPQEGANAFNSKEILTGITKTCITKA